MKKKLVALMLAGAMAFSMVSCSEDNKSDTKVEEEQGEEVMDVEEELSETSVNNSPVKDNGTDEVENALEFSLDYLLLPDSMRWNMAAQEVRDTENREENTLYSTTQENIEYITYYSSSELDKYGSSFNIVYCFLDNQLKAYWSQFDRENLSNPMDVYAEIKDFLIQKYGACESENISWTDTTYQNDISKWNDAFKYGYVTVETVWHTSDSAIKIIWDYNNQMTVSVSALDFESQL